MSVVQTDRALTVKFSEEDKTVYVSLENGHHLTFKYTFRCLSSYFSNKISVFFDVESKRCLVIVPMALNTYKCGWQEFWITNDVPTLSATWMMGQAQIIDSIKDDFKEKYAAYLLDNIINGV